MTTTGPDTATSGPETPASGPETPTSGPGTEVARPDRGARRDPLTARLRRRSGSLLVVAFALLLTVPWLLGGRTGGATENRASQPMPSIGAHDVLNEKIYRQVDAALRDRLTLRADLIQAVAASGYDTAGLSLNKRVHAGQNDELFIADDFTNPCEDKLDVNRLAQGLRDLSARSGNRPGAVTFVLAPDKSSVLSDELGPLGGVLLRCSDVQRGRIERLAAAEPGRVIDLFPKAVAMRAAEPGAELYTKVDTHWTPHLASIYGSTLVPRLAQQTGAAGVRWSDPVAQGTVTYGDLLAVLGVGPRQEVRDELVSLRPNAVTTRTQIPVPGARQIWVTRTTGAPVIGGRTLFVYDSFTGKRGFGNDYSAPQLIPYFGDATWVHWNDVKKLIASGRMPKVDRIVLESVQRGVGGVVDDIFLDPTVAAGLRTALTP